MEGGGGSGWRELFLQTHWMNQGSFIFLSNFPKALNSFEMFSSLQAPSFSVSLCVLWHCQCPPPTSVFWGWIASCLFMLSHESLKLKFACSSASHSYMFSFIVHFCYRILSQGCWTVGGCNYAERKISNSVSLWSHLSHSGVLWCLPRYEQQVKLSMCLRLSWNYKEKCLMQPSGGLQSILKEVLTSVLYWLL